MVMTIIHGLKVKSNLQLHLHVCGDNTYTGKSETLDEKLKSILAQFEYAYQIQYWEGEGVPFRTHFHVPECHPITGYLL